MLRARTVLLGLVLPATACGEDPVATATDADVSTGASTGTTLVPTTTADPTTTAPTDPGTMSAPGTSTGAPTTDTPSTSTATTGTTDTPSTSTDTASTGTSDTTDTSTTGTTDTSTSETTDTSTSDTTDTSTSGTTDTSDTTDTGDTTTGDPIEGLGYVGMSNGSTLMIFDPATAQVVAGPLALLPEGGYPYDATIKPGGDELWIVGATGDGVKIVDTASGQVVDQIDLTGVGDYPVDVLFSADGGAAYVSSRDSEALLVLDTATRAVTATIPLPAPMWGGKAVLDPCTDLVHMVDWYDGSLLTVDPVAETLTTTALGDSLWDLRVDAAGTTLYVTDRGLDVVHVVAVATMTLQTSVPVGDDPWGIDITSDDALVVVACEDDATVHFIDTAALTTTSLALPAGSDPRDVDIRADDAVAYVPTGDLPGNDGVHVIDLATGTLAGTIDLGVSANSNIVAVTPQPVECVP